MCEVCRKLQCDFRCPNYKSPKSAHYCSICDGRICNEEEYIENIDGECIHYDCVQGIRWLLEWLGYDIKTMEETENI